MLGNRGGLNSRRERFCRAFVVPANAPYAPQAAPGDAVWDGEGE